MIEILKNFYAFITSPTVILITTVVLILICAILIVPVIGKWKVYKKAGYPGWGIFIPYYNDYVLVRIAGLPWWCFVLKLLINHIVPTQIMDALINIVITILVASGFGKSIPFGIGLGIFPFIFYPILGLGKSQYRYPKYSSFSKNKKLPQDTF